MRRIIAEFDERGYWIVSQEETTTEGDQEVTSPNRDPFPLKDIAELNDAIMRFNDINTRSLFIDRWQNVNKVGVTNE